MAARRISSVTVRLRPSSCAQFVQFVSVFNKWSSMIKDLLYINQLVSFTFTWKADLWRLITQARYKIRKGLFIDNEFKAQNYSALVNESCGKLTDFSKLKHVSNLVHGQFFPSLSRGWTWADTGSILTCTLLVCKFMLYNSCGISINIRNKITIPFLTTRITALQYWETEFWPIYYDRGSVLKYCPKIQPNHSTIPTFSWATGWCRCQRTFFLTPLRAGRKVRSMTWISY